MNCHIIYQSHSISKEGYFLKPLIRRIIEKGVQMIYWNRHFAKTQVSFLSITIFIIAPGESKMGAMSQLHTIPHATSDLLLLLRSTTLLLSLHRLVKRNAQSVVEPKMVGLGSMFYMCMVVPVTPLPHGQFYSRKKGIRATCLVLDFEDLPTVQSVILKHNKRHAGGNKPTSGQDGNEEKNNKNNNLVSRQI